MPTLFSSALSHDGKTVRPGRYQGLTAFALLSMAVRTLGSQKLELHGFVVETADFFGFLKVVMQHQSDFSWQIASTTCTWFLHIAPVLNRF